MGAYAHVLVDIRFLKRGLLKLLVAACFGSLLARQEFWRCDSAIFKTAPVE